MKTLISILIVAAFAFFFTNCNDTGSILTSPGQNITDGNTEKPFTGSADGLTIEVNQAARHFEGTGESTLANGEVTAILDYLITSFNPGTGNGTTAFGKGTLVTSGGSKLYLIGVAGTFNITGTTCTFTSTGKLAGGTGEFNNVLGDITYTGTMDVITRVTHGEWTGTLNRAKPFTGTLTGVNGTVTNPSCSAGFVRRHSNATADITHFGESVAVLEHCFSFTTFLVTDGMGSLTADNGDKMYVTYNGYASPIPNTQTANITLFCKITGGTGKFNNAAGYFTFIGVQNYISGAVTGTVDGAIDY